MLYNKLGERKNCQTHRSYVFFPVESNGVISFSITRIFKQIVQTIEKFYVFSQIIIIRSNVHFLTDFQFFAMSAGLSMGLNGLMGILF